MSYSEQWQTQITDSLTECAKLAAANNKVDLKYELLIVGIFWPIRQAIRDFDLEAITCVNQIAGKQAQPVLRMVQEWGDDPLVVAQALASQGIRRGEISKALNQFIVYFDAFTAYAKQLANQVRPAAPPPALDEPPPAATPRVMVFALNQDGAVLAGELHQRLKAAGIATWGDLSSLEGERTWWAQVTQALDQVDFLVLAMTEAALTSHLIRRLWRYARQQGVCIYPIFKADDLHFERLPRWIRQVHFYNLKLEWPKLLDDLKGTCEIPRVPFMVEDLPENFVERPALFEPTLAHIFDREQEEGLANIIALVGPTGYGKTTLATALCHDENIRQIFDNGILWVTLGENPGDLCRPIIDLIEILSGERPGFTGLDAALVRFGELITDRDLLIVIDDVWNATHLKPFLQGGNRCARIITTRNAETLPLEVETIKVGPMLLDEAVALLSTDLPDGYLAERRRLARRLGEWPLLLKLTNGTLRDRVHNNNESLLAALNYAYHALDCQGITAFDVDHSAGRRRAVGQALDISLRLLNNTERARYNELAIFPDGVDIPLAVLEKLWGATGGLDDFDTEDLCLRLYELCLLAQFDLTSRYIRLHKAMHTYLHFQKTTDLAALHQQLLDAYRVAWVALPADDVYMWAHLFYHLVEAGRISDLVATVEDVGYLVNKIKVRGVYYAESDLLTAEAASPDNQLLPQVRRALSQASHILARCDTLDQIANTLQSRLVHLPLATELLVAAEPRLPKPRLTALCAVPDLPDSTLIRTLKGHNTGILTCTVSGDGSKIVSASKDGCLIVWDAVTGNPLRQLQESEAEIWGCDISSDGSTVVYALNDGRLVLVDLQVEQQAVAWQAHQSSVMSCAINTDGSVVVSASKDQSVKIWDAKTRTKRLEFNSHTRTVTGCDISADGTTVAAISNDGDLKIWNICTGREQFSTKMQLRHAGINQLTFVSQRDINFTCALSADGAIVAAASSGGTVGVWEVASKRERLTLVADRHGVSDCNLNQDGSLLACALGNNLLKVWETATGQERVTLADHNRQVNSCALTLSGAVLISASDDQSLKIWDCERSRPRLADPNHQIPAKNCTITADGRMAVSASTSKTLQVWNFCDHSQIIALEGHTHKINDCQIGSDGTVLVSCSQDQSIVVWDMDTFNQLWTLTGHTWSVNGCALNTDGAIIVSASDDRTLKVWDGQAGRERSTLTGHTRGVTACALSIDSQTLVSASGDGSLIIWHPLSGEKRGVLTGHTAWVNKCAISANGATIVSASYDRTLKVWDACRQKERLTLIGHSMSVTGCAISADGQIVVSVSRDKSAKVWDARTGVCLTTLFVDEPLLDCACSAEAKAIIAVSMAGTYFLHFER